MFLSYSDVAGMKLSQYNRLRQKDSLFATYQQFSISEFENCSSSEKKNEKNLLKQKKSTFDSNFDICQTDYRNSHKFNDYRIQDIQKYRDNLPNISELYDDLLRLLPTTSSSANYHPTVRNEPLSISQLPNSDVCIFYGDFQNPDIGVDDLDNYIDEADAENDEGREFVPVSGSFYCRKKKSSNRIKSVRYAANKEKIRPYVVMTHDLSIKYYELYRYDHHLYIKNRTIIRKEDSLHDISKRILLQCVTFDRKRYMLQMQKYVKESKADDLFKHHIGLDVSDTDMINRLVAFNQKLAERCGYNNNLKVCLGEIKRNGTISKEVISITWICKPAVELFKDNVHILYVDAGYTSENGYILLAVFLDANHHVQPIGFQLSPTENKAEWLKFFQSLLEAGIDYRDLVINSDRGAALVSAANQVFPWAERTFCFVHFERNIQSAWEREHGSLSFSNMSNVEKFNKFMDYLNLARISTTHQECQKYLKLMENLELREFENTCVFNYIDNEKENILMHMWNKEHLMQDTTNPVEICMNLLTIPHYGYKACREEVMYNQACSLIRLCYDRIEIRHHLLKIDYYVPISTNNEIPCRWLEKEVIHMAHYVETYKNQFQVVDVTETQLNSPLRHQFKVKDSFYKNVFDVNIQSGTCSCHLPHWKKYPCIHIIYILHMRKQFNRVWSLVSPIYYLDNIKKTTRLLTVEENECLDTLLNDDCNIEQVISFIVSNYRGYNYKKSQRMPSRGENTISSFVCYRT